MAALASRAVADEVLPLLLAPGTGLGARMEAAEADVRGLRVQLEAAMQGQEAQACRSGALEEQVRMGGGRVGTPVHMPSRACACTPLAL